MEYNLDYFIEKFGNTPDDKWCTNRWEENGSFCANGWCGAHADIGKNSYGEDVIKGTIYTEESAALCKVFLPLDENNWLGDWSQVASRINDGTDLRYQQATPKKRIMAALYDLKRMEIAAREKKKIEIQMTDSEKALMIHREGKLIEA